MTVSRTVLEKKAKNVSFISSQVDLLAKEQSKEGYNLAHRLAGTILFVIVLRPTPAHAQRKQMDRERLLQRMVVFVELFDKGRTRKSALSFG